MKRIQVMCLLAMMSAMMIAGCVSTQTAGSGDRGGTRSSPIEVNRQKAQDLTGEIEDLRSIKQDVRPFAAAITAPLGADEQALALEQFRERYFSPWTAPLDSLNQALEYMKDLVETTWYGENRIRVEPERVKGLLTLAAPDSIPSLNQFGIAIAPAPVRALPTLRPFYKTPDDFPFDQLQYTELKPNEPVRILHLSADGAWLYIKTAAVHGWVEAGAVRVADESLRRMVMTSRQVVVVKDFAVIRDEQGNALPQPRIGTLYPLAKDESAHWLVYVAVAGDGEKASLKKARIAGDDARHHPLPFTAATVARIGNELLKTPYGWGELYRDRDCSATTRDFFLPFGIWLPRNSMSQFTLGPFVPLASLPNAEKENILRRQGVPFRTLVHRKGHIMLYAGLMDGRPVILHNTWAISYKPADGPEEKYFIGRTVLSTLEAGKELPLSRGTTLDHLDGILQLPVSGSAGKGMAAKRRGSDLLLNYPDIKTVKENAVLFADGTSLPYDDGKLKSFTQKLRHADIEDHFAQSYPSFTSIAESDSNENPGRFRNEALFDKLYGASRSEIEKNLVAVRWLPAHGGGTLLFNNKENAAAQLQKVSDELDTLPDEYIKYLQNVDVTYYYRAMGSSGDELPHRYGIAIDLERKITTCRRPDAENRCKNEIPQKIVEIFEKYGFVWGGRWYRFDTGHFEYRPEMFDRVF
jgi:cell wall-associated NlpC family hydrolase